MKTLDRQTASSIPTRNQLETLSRNARALWSATPPGNPDQRENLCMQLICLESDIDRLRIRSSSGQLAENLGKLSNCAERLGELERRWELDPISTTGLRGRAS